MRIIVWGTGPHALEFAELCDPAISVAAHVDLDPQKTGSQFLGRRVIRPEDMAGLDYDYLLITPFHWREPKELALNLGIPAAKIMAFYETRFACLAKFGRQGLLPQELSPALVAELDSKPWYHEVEIFPGVKTPGPARPRFELIRQLTDKIDVSGKRVLDIGAWNGPYSFAMRDLGCQVTGYDIQDPERSGFNLINQLKKANVGFVTDSVYNLGAYPDFKFDIVLYFGVYYHLLHPLAALANIFKVLEDDGVLLFEGAVLDYAYNVDPLFAPLKDKMAPYTELPLAYFTSAEYHGDASNWYVPNMLCLRQWLNASGFEVESLTPLPERSRAYGLARKIKGFVGEEHIRL